jgi:hypothetical protein
MTLPDISLATLFGALLGFVPLVITKEYKISEIRQAWIDSLRSETSVMISHFLRYGAGRSSGLPEDKMADYLQSYHTSEALVRLRLNPREQQSQTVTRRLEEMNRLISTGDLDRQKLHTATSALISELQPLLKAEWKRVKEGESWFRGSKILCIVGFVVAATFEIIRAIQHP